MQEMMRCHERFCSFNKMYLNKEKCTYIVMNAKATPATKANEQGRKRKVDAREQVVRVKDGAIVVGRRGEEEQVAEKLPHPPRWLPRKRVDEDGTVTQVEGEQAEPMGGRIGKPIKDDPRHFKYLGVWFNVERGWKIKSNEKRRKRCTIRRQGPSL